MSKSPIEQLSFEQIAKRNASLDFTSKTRIVYLGLGSNIGNRSNYLSEAKSAISDRIGTIQAVSSIYESEAWGNTDQQDFLNQVIAVETTLSPLNLVEATKAIESQLGKEKISHWGPRVIDIDILLYENHIIIYQHLKIPHERMTERNFVLVPLREIAPEVVHPTERMTITELLAICPDDKKLWLFEG